MRCKHWLCTRASPVTISREPEPSKTTLCLTFLGLSKIGAMSSVRPGGSSTRPILRGNPSSPNNNHNNSLYSPNNRSMVDLCVYLAGIYNGSNLYNPNVISIPITFITTSLCILFSLSLSLCVCMCVPAGRYTVSIWARRWVCTRPLMSCSEGCLWR